MSDFRKRDAIVRTKRWYLLPLLSIALLIPSSALLHLVSSLGATLVFFSLFFLALFGLMHVETRFWRSERANVLANGEGLLLDGERVLARDEVGGVRVVVRDEHVLVRLEHGRDAIEIVVASKQEGRALVEAMRLDATRTVAPYWFNHGTQRRAIARTVATFTLLLLGFAMLFELPWWLAPEFILIPLAFGLYLAGGPWFVRIAVGADGLRLRRDLGRERFVAYADLEGLELRDGEIALRIRGEPPFVVSAGGRGVWRFLLSIGRNNFGQSEEVIDAFVRRVEENLAVHGGRGALDVGLLARASRSTEQWLRDLDELGEGRAAYRVAALPPDTLWRVVEDASSPATQRAGAAVVLRASLDEGGRVRLRAAAEACASPRLRVALDAAGAASANALADALDAVEDERPKQKARR